MNWAALKSSATESGYGGNQKSRIEILVWPQDVCREILFSSAAYLKERPVWIGFVTGQAFMLELEQAWPEEKAAALLFQCH
jgi:hypothetical protein